MDTIFVVDDSDTVLAFVVKAIGDYYRVMTMPSAMKMFTLMAKVKPDLILLDIEMPEINGLETLKRLKASKDYADIPVIFLTGRTDADTEVIGFELGAHDFISKPFSGPVLLNRIRTHLHIDAIVRERTKKLRQVRDSIVRVFAQTIEKRDDMTGGHVERTSEYMKILLRAMLAHGVYADEINEQDIDMVASSARLHDVGKIHIPDSILNKNGKLTDEEYAQMKTHSEMGVAIIEEILSEVSGEKFLQTAKLIAHYHHERWDGKGYPQGLAGTDIPLYGRVMAVCDVYDALTSVRPYKKAFSHDEALNIITSEAGKQFDPKIAQVFFEEQAQFNTANMASTLR